jgi:hypothetical protein
MLAPYSFLARSASGLVLVDLMLALLSKLQIILNKQQITWAGDNMIKEATCQARSLN